jgi:hypothetical protein
MVARSEGRCIRLPPAYTRFDACPPFSGNSLGKTRRPGTYRVFQTLGLKVLVWSSECQGANHALSRASRLSEPKT